MMQIFLNRQTVPFAGPHDARRTRPASLPATLDRFIVAAKTALAVTQTRMIGRLRQDSMGRGEPEHVR
jgi:hypothetical protein